MNSVTGPAFVSGVIATVYAIMNAMAGRGDGKTYHRYEIGSEQEHAFAQGCEFASTKMLGGAEFALQVKGDQP